MPKPKKEKLSILLEFSKDKRYAKRIIEEAEERDLSPTAFVKMVLINTIDGLSVSVSEKNQTKKQDKDNKDIDQEEDLLLNIGTIKL